MRTFRAMLMIALVSACQSGSERGASASDAPDDRPPTPDVTPVPEPVTLGVVLRVEPDRASAGATVELILQNGSNGSIGYNLCTSGLERQSAGGWEPVPSDHACTMELRTLEPGQDARFSLDLPGNLAAGTYRTTTTVEWLETGDRRAVTSNAFDVA